jgi:hypothetical protein
MVKKNSLKDIINMTASKENSPDGTKMSSYSPNKRNSYGNVQEIKFRQN